MRFTRGGFMILSLLVSLSLTLMTLTAQNPAVMQESRTVTVEGVGSIVNNDVAHARDDAINAAQRTAIEQAVGILLESETVVENFQLLEDRIYSQSRGYISSWDVLRESRRGEDLYEVTIKAVVKTADLANDIDGIRHLFEKKNRPRMMVIIDERNIGESAGSYHYIEADMNTAETAITNALLAKGFKFVDQATVKHNLKQQQAAAILGGDVKQAAALGKLLNAEVVITGKALAKATVVEAFGAKTRSQQATVSVRALRTDTGDIIAMAEAQGKYPHIDDIAGGVKAIQQACEKVSDELVEKILSRWESDIAAGTSVTMTVKGVTGFDQLNQFTSNLSSIVRGITSVVQKEWVDQIATLDIVMKGNTTDLARRLSGQTIGSFTVKVVGMTQNSVTVELIGNRP